MRRAALGFAALLGLALPLRAQTIPVALGGQRTSLVGLPFGVPITVDMSARTDKLGAFAMRLSWNPAVLQFKSGANGSFGSITVNTDSVAAGVIRLTGANPAGVSGLVTIGTGTFVPLTADTATFGLQLSELYAAGTFADLLASAQVAAPAVYCPARGRFGDINGDGNVGSADALIALTSVVGLPTGGYDLTLGDVDASGSTTARDALIMLSSAVGLDVTAYRVYQIAGGSCAAFANATMAIVPGSFNMLVGQQAPLEARRIDSTGALVTLTDIVWKSSKPGVVGVLADGTALARDTGTATITAVHGTTDSAAAIIRVDSNRTVQLVDARAVSAPVQLGSAAYPFGTIAQAMAAARAGDTVEVKPGTYQEAVTLDKDVRLLGDTTAGGARPVLVNPVGDGIHLTSAGSREVHNFGFGAVSDAVNVDGPSSVLLTGLVGQGLPTGIVVTSGVPVIRLVNSHLDGNGVAVCCSSYGVEASNGPLDSLIIDGSDIGGFYSSGVYAPYGGTFVVRHSQLHDFGTYALYLGINSGPGVRLSVDSSALLRGGSELLYLADLAAGSVTHSVLVPSQGGSAVYQFQENVPAGGYLVLHDDSLDVANGTWLYANDLDSVIVDSVVANIPQASGSAYNVKTMRVTRSAFTNVSSQAFYIDNSTGGGVLDVRHVSFAGDPRSDLQGYQVQSYNMRATVDSSAFQNAYRAVDIGGDSGLTVTHSTFTHIQYPVTYNGNWYVGCTGVGCPSPLVGATVRHNAFAGYYKAVDVELGAMAVDSNGFTGNGSAGIYVYHPTSASVTFNGMAGDGTPIDVEISDTSVTARITDNTITGATTIGIFAGGAGGQDTIHARFEVLRNQVACTPSTNPSGIQAYYTDALIASNQITGCSYGVYLYSPQTAVHADSVAGNTIQLPLGGSGADYGGVVALFNLRTRIVGNAVTLDTAGAASYGPLYVATQGYPSGTAAFVDSNTVNGGLYYGISVFDADTALIAGNTLQSVNNGAVSAAILLNGVGTQGAVVGNIVRRPSGAGIAVTNNVPAPITVDSNMVSHAGLQGVVVQGIAPNGTLQVTRNTLDSNRIGIEVYASLFPVISQNNLFGNTFYGLLADGPGVAALNNWWGDTLGPICNPQFLCNSASLGDSVSTTVTWIPALTAPVASAPPPSAPRVFAAARLAAPRATLLRMPAPDLMPTRTSAETFAPPAPALITTAVRPVPAGASPALARILRQAAEQRAADVARMNQRAQQAAARRAERARRLEAAATSRPSYPSPANGPAYGPAERRP